MRARRFTPYLLLLLIPVLSGSTCDYQVFDDSQVLVESLHPLGDREDSASDSALVGVWLFHGLGLAPWFENRALSEAVGAAAAGEPDETQEDGTVADSLEIYFEGLSDSLFDFDWPDDSEFESTDSSIVQILAKEGGGYEIITEVDDGTQGHLDANLLRLGDVPFLDITAIRLVVPPRDTALVIPFESPSLQTFYRMSVDGDTLRIMPLLYHPLKSMLERDPQQIAHDRLKGKLILTAQIQELQEFFLDAGCG